MNDPETIPVLLLGDHDVGKSTFIARLTLGPSAPPNSTLPVLSDMSQPFVFDIRMKDDSYRLEFYDNNSPENYTLLRPAVIVLCFSIADRTSLESIQEGWKKQVETHFNYDEALPIILLGLKRDLREAGDATGGIKGGQILPQEAVRIASEMRCDLYAECSAISGELVGHAWTDLVKTAVATRRAGGGKSAGAHCVIL